MALPQEIETVVELPDIPPELAPPCVTEGTSPDQVLDAPEQFELEGVGEAPPELAPLLRYLEVPLATFELNEQRYFGALGNHLRRHGVVAQGGTVDRTNYRDAVRAFQKARKLGVDGIPGQDLCWELQREWAEARALSVERVDADKVSGSGGYDRFYLRADAVDAYRAMRRDVLAAGGVISSAGAIRALDADVGTGRSSTSMHYSGLALDLALDTGMGDPKKDPYVVVEDGRKWRVWCRSPSAPARTLDAVVCRNGKKLVQQVTVNAFDLTEIAQRYGFARIGWRTGFPEKYVCAEWWHFQYELALVPWISQFGIELLAIAGFRTGAGQVLYDEAHLAKYDLWKSRKCLYQRMKDGWW